MAIGEDLGAVAVEDEEIGMAAVGEGEFGLFTEALAEAGEPGFGAFPGVEVAVELFAAEGAIVVGEVDFGAFPGSGRGDG